MTTATASAGSVAELRRLTNCPMMECKKALEEANGDFEKAQVILREKLGATSSTNLSSKEGLLALATHTYEDGLMKYSLVEITTSTDFAANSLEAKEAIDRMANDLLLTHGENQTSELTTLKSKVLEPIALARSYTSPQFGGNGVKIGHYMHHDRKTASIVVASNADSVSQEVMNQVAMHLAGTEPEPVASRPEEVTEHYLTKEREFRTKQAIASGKPPEIQAKMVAGAMTKFRTTLSLTGQPYLLNPSKTVADILGSAIVVDFRKWKVGF